LAVSSQLLLLIAFAGAVKRGPALVQRRKTMRPGPCHAPVALVASLDLGTRLPVVATVEPLPSLETWACRATPSFCPSTSWSLATASVPKWRRVVS